MEAEQPSLVKRGRGRPIGSKNKPRPELPEPVASVRLVPPMNHQIQDYRHADPLAMIDRQFSIIDWAQQALRNEMTGGFAAKGEHVSIDVRKITELSNALARNVEALKKAQDVMEELAKRMSPEQLLEAAIRKLEGQDLKTLNHAIKRLRAHRERLAPVTGGNAERAQIGSADEEKATDAIASLLTE